MPSIVPAQSIEDIRLSAGLGEQFTLIIIFGPAELAEPGLVELRDQLVPERRVLRHRIEREGPNIVAALTEREDPRPAILVSGLERMSLDHRLDMLPRMNLLRDNFSSLPAVVILWVPLESAEEFRRHCVDLFHWRTLTVFIRGPAQPTPAELDRRARHDYLRALAATLYSWRDPPRAAVNARTVVSPDGRVIRASEWLASVQRGVLLGPAGMGKSTQLQRYAGASAEAALDLRHRELPVLVVARWLARGRLDPLALARVAARAHPHAPEHIESIAAWLAVQIERSSTCLMIDGLDELRDDTRRALDDLLAELLGGANELRVIIATRGARTQTLEAEAGWSHAELEPLTAEAVADWLYGEGLEPDRPDAYMGIAESESLAPFTRNPMMLGLLVELVRRHGRLPSDQNTELTAALVDHLLDSRDRDRELVRPTFITTSRLKAGLARVAFDMLEEDQSIIHIAALRRIATGLVGDLVPAASAIEEFEAAVNRSGILRPQTDVDYSFSHALFRDYFAGEALEELLNERSERDERLELLITLAQKPQWRAVLVHALALRPARALGEDLDELWRRAGDAEDLHVAWVLRGIAIDAGLQGSSRVREQTLEHAWTEVERAKRDGEPEDLWAEIAVRIEDEDYPC